MSNPEDLEINKERQFRHDEIIRGAERMEKRAIALILEAAELRKVAKRVIESATLIREAQEAHKRVAREQK